MQYTWALNFQHLGNSEQQRTLQQIPSATQVTVTTPTISSISAVTPTRLSSEIQGLGTSGSFTEHPRDCIVFCSTHRCQRLCFSLIVRSLWWRKRLSVKLIGHGVFQYWYRTVNFPMKINYHKFPYYCWSIHVTCIYEHIFAYIYVYVLNLKTKKPSWLSMLLSVWKRWERNYTQDECYCHTLLNMLIVCSDKSTAKKLNR